MCVGDDGFAALHYAAAGTVLQRRCVELVLGAGAAPNVRSRCGKRPLQIAIEKENWPVRGYDQLCLQLAVARPLPFARARGPMPAGRGRGCDH